MQPQRHRSLASASEPENKRWQRKKLLMFEEVRQPVPIVASGSFRNFSRYRVAFPSEVGAALGFLSTVWAKPKSRFRLKRQKLRFFCQITVLLRNFHNSMIFLIDL